MCGPPFGDGPVCRPRTGTDRLDVGNAPRGFKTPGLRQGRAVQAIVIAGKALGPRALKQDAPNLNRSVPSVHPARNQGRLRPPGERLPGSAGRRIVNASAYV